MTETEYQSIAVTLAAHTNAGKTTLARTLLGRDVGETRDSEHTTSVSDSYTWLESKTGDSLQLWDTPGFGDTRRLLKRLQSSEQSFGRFLTETWDRIVDKGFYFSQRALRNVRDESDCVLYLVNCAEAPQLNGILDAEMQLLKWLDKPVIAVLNQTGDQLASDEMRAEETLWIALFADRYPWVRKVIPLDAFARCWIQEWLLLETISACLPQSGSLACARLSSNWLDIQQRRFEEACGLMCTFLIECAQDSEPDITPVKRLTSLIGSKERSTLANALDALGSRLEHRAESLQLELARIHDLIPSELADLSAMLERNRLAAMGIDQNKVSLLGGAVSGIATGLFADLASGGMSLGGGMLIGAIAGALGARAAGYGINRVRGIREARSEWSNEALTALCERVCALYLLIAHSGRGRGSVALQTDAGRWQPQLTARIQTLRPALDAVWLHRDERDISADLSLIIEQLIAGTLQSMYPDIRVVQGDRFKWQNLALGSDTTQT